MNSGGTMGAQPAAFTIANGASGNGAATEHQTTFTEDQVRQIGKYLRDPQNPLKARFRALFALRNINTPLAVEMIGECFDDESDLLRHELAYCLGQMQRVEGIPYLKNAISNLSNGAIVRHEAGEALAAIGTLECLQTVLQFRNDPIQEVRETCLIAVSRIAQRRAAENMQIRPCKANNYFFSIDPAYPCDETNLPFLEVMLVTDALNLYHRYKAMFALRNINTPEATLVLCKGLQCRESALFRHEIAFVLGQIQNPNSFHALKSTLNDLSESPMVRHEAAEALGAIGTPDCFAELQKFLDDPERLVRESCEIALDMCEYEMNNEFQYADGSAIIKATNPA